VLLLEVCEVVCEDDCVAVVDLLACDPPHAAIASAAKPASAETTQCRIEDIVGTTARSTLYPRWPNSTRP
jgi:hypothetical protein